MHVVAMLRQGREKICGGMAWNRYAVEWQRKAENCKDIAKQGDEQRHGEEWI